MKQSLSLMAAAIVLSAISPVYAASSVDLSVSGTITPSACTPTLSAGGVVDHGKISVQDLGNAPTPLPEAVLQLAINCEAATLVAIKGTDNRAGTSAESDIGLPNYGLGLTSGNKKIGWYRLKMLNALADDIPSAVIESIDGQTWMDAPDGTIWQPSWMRSLTGAAGVGAVPLPMQMFTTDVVVATTITDKRELPVAEEILIDGSATLDIVYL
jgi:hypothetical protein